jgi:RNA polymerase sigma factor (sigma-70 family)
VSRAARIGPEDGILTRSKQAISQELLVLRCQRGERQAFDELIRLWEERLFYYIRRLVHSEEDAWDVLQQTWVRVLKGLRTLRDPARLPVWLYQVARAAALSHWRGHYRVQSRREPDYALAELPANETVDPLEDAEVIHRALNRISVAHREVLTLHFLEEFSVDQMAEILGIAEGTVKSRLFHARRALRAVLEHEEGGS